MHELHQLDRAYNSDEEISWVLQWLNHQGVDSIDAHQLLYRKLARISYFNEEVGLLLCHHPLSAHDDNPKVKTRYTMVCNNNPQHVYLLSLYMLSELGLDPKHANPHPHIFEHVTQSFMNDYAQGRVEKLIEHMPQGIEVCVHGHMQAQLFQRLVPVSCQVRVNNAAQLKPYNQSFDNYVEQCAQDGLEVRILGEDNLDIILKHYTLFSAPDYFLNRLKQGLFMALYQRDEQELCGFVGEHAEGAIGMLEVLPQHRRKGYGSLLMQLACARTYEKGFIPFDQIELNNEASQHLQRSLGFKIGTEEVVWFETL